MKMKKIVALLAAAIMTLSMALPVFAQTVPDAEIANDKATITINNASKGEEYKVYKLFSASVTGEPNGPIAYEGTVPKSLEAYFQNTSGNISVVEDVKTDDLKAALKAWAATATPAATAVSDGSVLQFVNLDYGYYVVTTTQGAQNITVDSTNPDASIYDKNETTPIIPEGEGKTVAGDKSVAIGDIAEYTIKFNTSNYDGAGERAKQIGSYIINDTLPEFLAGITVKSIIIDEDADLTTTNDQTEVTAQFDDKKIVISWVDENNTSLYKNGAKIVVVYEGTVTDKAVIAGNGNTNELTVTWTYTDGSTPDPKTSKLEDTETIFTYAVMIKKVNVEGKALAGAKFSIPGYVLVEDTQNPGVYTVIKRSTTPAEVVTPESGIVIIKGVDKDPIIATETEAPKGYNKLAEYITLTPSETKATKTTVVKYLDENGNVVDTQTSVVVSVNDESINAGVEIVVNKSGSLLPSTGGVGTTMFYIIGGCIIAAAVVILAVKRRRA